MSEPLRLVLDEQVIRSATLSQVQQHRPPPKPRSLWHFVRLWWRQRA